MFWYLSSILQKTNYDRDVFSLNVITAGLLTAKIGWTFALSELVHWLVQAFPLTGLWLQMLWDSLPLWGTGRLKQWQAFQYLFWFKCPVCSSCCCDCSYYCWYHNHHQHYLCAIPLDPWDNDTSSRADFSSDCQLGSSSSWYPQAFAHVEPMIWWSDQVSIDMRASP